mmetsp:Transcript_132753/g.258529  ORF Transcript_132753/g.258529 Transcript_132753/m.258529 type:complete len:139 (+) Transcript_132753:107-523(+)
MVSLSLCVFAAIMPMGTAVPAAYKCVCHACEFAKYTEGKDYKYHSTTLITREACQAACTAESKCTGIEHPDDEKYCAFWYGEACALQDGTTAKFIDWTAGETCTKESALAASASQAPPSAIQLIPALLLGSSLLAFVY